MTALRRTRVVREERREQSGGSGRDGGCTTAAAPVLPAAPTVSPAPAAIDTVNGASGAPQAQQAQHGQRATPDAQRIRVIYEAHFSAVYRFIYSKVGNREEAEDLTSQVFIKALRGLDDSRDAASVQAWLFQVARTTIADSWRVYYRLPERSLDALLAAGWDSATPTTHPDGADQQGVEQRARQILAQLPARYREVLTCRFLLNYSLKETAARMGLSEANVKVLQFRALKKAAQFSPGADTPTDAVNTSNGGAS